MTCPRAWAALVVAGFLTLGACAKPASQAHTEPAQIPATTSTETPSPTPSATPAAPAFDARLNVSDGAKAVPVDTLLAVEATGGGVRSVKVAVSGNSKAQPIDGTVAPNGSWVAKSRLDPATKYAVEAVAADAAGVTKTIKAAFTTAEIPRSQEVFATLTPVPELKQEYGVGMPIVLQFDVPVTNKAEFERNLHVTSVPEQEGSWGWVSDTEVRYRPKEKWRPGTKVNLDANLNGVNAGRGAYGQESRRTQFTVGRDQSINVDLKSKRLTFDSPAGKLDIPVSGGDSDHVTRTGTQVIMEKFDKTRMNSETTGISNQSADGYDMEVSYAMRITQSGEFLHAAPWNAGYFGRTNASHGCVGMSTTNADKLFERAQVGDIVTTTGTNRTLENDNGWTMWALSWDEWKAKSALK